MDDDTKNLSKTLVTVDQLCFSWQMFYMVSYASCGLYLIVIGLLTLSQNKYKFYQDIYLVIFLPLMYFIMA